jgi:hypothetical protein
VGGEDFKDIMGLVGVFSKDLMWCLESSIDRLSKEHKAVFAGVWGGWVGCVRACVCARVCDKTFVQR